MLRFTKTFLLLFVLSGCAGTGTTSYSTIAPQLSTNEKGKIFVYRQSGYVGGGALIDVSLNGALIGQLGNGEMIYAQMKLGKNLIEAKVSGIQGVGLNSPMLEIQNNEKKNNFFIIGFKTGLLTNEMTLIEITEDSWKMQAR
tara:strand:- start:548 stop:973 length:426 start_codon:yes stop_codon:yes gene_type:complete